MVNVPSGDGAVCVCHSDCREENARRYQIWFHEWPLGEVCECRLTRIRHDCCGNWPQQLRFEEPASKGRQDDWSEADHDGMDQQACIADHPSLVKSVSHEKERMGDGSGGVRHTHNLPLYGPRIAET